MNALVRTELLKLRVTRSTWVLLGLAVLLSGVRVAMVLNSAGTAAGVEPGTAEAALTVVGAAATGTVLMILVGIVAVTWEFRHQTLTGTLLMVPDRRNVVAAKAVALALTGAAAGVAFGAAGVGVAVARGLAGPVDVGSWLALLVAIGLGTAFWGWFGVAVGLLVRNQTAALLVPLGWLLVVEPLVGSFGQRGVVPWLPGSLTGALAGSGAPGTPPVYAAFAVLVAYGVALTAPGLRRLSMSDVT